jgi:MoaA/NifB/PqqE/SkfB family radical SAM enzyme
MPTTEFNEKDNQEELHNKHEELTNEIYNHPEMLPSRYVYIITNKCNLNCDFCFMKKHTIENPMTAEDWINLTDQIPDYAKVTITGGEPFLFPKFKEVFSYIASRFNCSIISNGTLLTEELSDFLLSHKNFKVLSISVDNLGNTLRNINPNIWKKTEEQIKYFLKKRDELNSGCVLDLKTTVLNDNAEELFEIHKYCVEELGCDTHVFQFLKGSPIQHADILYEFEDILKESHAEIYKKFDIVKDQFKKIKEYNLKTKTRAFLHPKVGSLISEEVPLNIGIMNKSQHIKENFKPCKYAWSSMHVNVDGSIFPCLAIPMGNIKENTLKEIMLGKKRNSFCNLIREQGTIEACNRCGWLKPANINVEGKSY